MLRNTKYFSQCFLWGTLALFSSQGWAGKNSVFFTKDAIKDITFWEKEDDVGGTAPTWFLDEDKKTVQHFLVLGIFENTRCILLMKPEFQYPKNAKSNEEIRQFLRETVLKGEIELIDSNFYVRDNSRWNSRGKSQDLLDETRFAKYEVKSTYIKAILCGTAANREDPEDYKEMKKYRSLFHLGV